MQTAPPLCVECLQPLTRLAPGETIIIKMQHAGDGRTRMHGLCAQLLEHLKRSLVGADVAQGTALKAFEKAARFEKTLHDSQGFKDAKWLYERIKARP